MSPTLDLTRDCSCFVLEFFEVINTSAPHIYVSALPLSPQESLIYNLYKQYACPQVRVVQGLPMLWDTILATVYCENLNRGVAWSPCSRFIAIAKYGVIEILDGATLECLNTFRSPHETWCEYLLFSPDSCTLTQHSEVQLICWDLQTGVPVGTTPSPGKIEYCMSAQFAYSPDGRILVVLHYLSPYSTLLNTYDFLSGTHTGSYPPPEGYVAHPFWTHGDCLRFATVETESITIWEAEFTSINTPAIVENLPVPASVNIGTGNFLFLPALSQLAFASRLGVYIWDAQNSRILLNSWTNFTNSGVGGNMAFSSDGHFFSHMNNDQDAYVWKRSLASYILHQKVTLPAYGMNILLSPDGESIIATGESSICLWHTRDQILSPSRVPDYYHHLLEFSPNEVLAASARGKGKTVTIINLQSGDSQLIIDVDMEIMCMGLTESTVAVVGLDKIVTWNVSAENSTSTRASLNDSIRTTILDITNSYPDIIYHNGLWQIERSISPDLSRIAIRVMAAPYTIQIYDMSTGRQLAVTNVSKAPPLIALSKCEVWDMDDDGSAKGWKIIEDGRSGIDRLEPLEATLCPPPVFPWQSNNGYEVTDDGWVLSPSKKRLLWLPHRWRSNEKSRMWSGRFLGLQHKELSEVVILEFFE